MNTNALVTVGIALGVCYAVTHFVKSPAVKAMALGVAGTIVAKKIPFVQDALA